MGGVSIGGIENPVTNQFTTDYYAGLRSNLFISAVNFPASSTYWNPSTGPGGIWGAYLQNLNTQTTVDLASKMTKGGLKIVSTGTVTNTGAGGSNNFGIYVDAAGAQTNYGLYINSGQNYFI